MTKEDEMREKLRTDKLSEWVDEQSKKAWCCPRCGNFLIYSVLKGRFVCPDPKCGDRFTVTDNSGV